MFIVYLRGCTLASCTQEMANSIGVVISVLQLHELKPKAWKGGQDLVVFCFMPFWREDEALAEDIDAQGSLHATLDIQDSA